MRKAAYIANVLVMVLSAAIASGVKAQANDVALARQLFEQGIAFVDEEDWTQAADRFQRSLELRPSPIVAYNLGSALVELGRLVTREMLLEKVIYQRHDVGAAIVERG